MFALMKSRTTLKMGHEQSLGHMLEKLNVCSRGHIFKILRIK